MSTKKTQILFGISLAFLFSLCLALSAFAEGASIFLYPGSKSFKVDDIFSIEVKIDTAGLPINAAQAVIYFPPDKLEVLSISTSDSIFTLWPVEPNFSNSSGQISFAGGLPHPGFEETGSIITPNFRAKEEGVANLTLEEGRILANDGKGTNILVFVKEGKYSIQKMVLAEIEPGVAQVLSPSHPQQGEWYSNNSPEFQWKTDSDITGASFVLDRSSDTIPDTGSEGRAQSKTYKNIEDGVWYFHLRAESESGWSQSSHYKVQIDTYPPYPFEIIVDNEGDPTNPSPKVYFETDDEVSGINYYKVKVGEGSFSNLMLARINPFPLSLQTPGKYPIVVRAMDMAGNGVEAKTVIDVEPIESPKITVWPKKHISGEETLYIEGTSLPGVEIILSLEKDGEKVKTWIALSNSQGEWSFFTKKLIKSGTYYLSAQAKDEREAVSEPSEKYEIEVSLSGLSLGPMMISFRRLVLLLFLVLFLGIILTIYFVPRNIRAKKSLRKETKEAREGLNLALNVLGKEIEKRIELMDSKPGFSKEERKACDELKRILEAVEEFVDKEIRDIEEGL